MLTGGLLATALLVPTTRAHGQQVDSARIARDSLAARLERAEAAVEMLRQQVAAQSESAVSTRSGLKLELNGRVLISAFGNTRRTNNADVPTFVRPDTANGLPDGGGGIAIRQTTLGLAVTSTHVLGAEFRGDVDVDFFGGQQPSGGGRTFPLLRLRTARAQLTWPGVELLLGQEQPLVAGVNPVSLASVGTPGYASAGNLWLWLPQARLTFESNGRVKFGISGAVLAPTSGEAASAFDTDFDAAERTRRPYVEARVRARWGEGDTQGEVGVGAHRGWFATGRDSLLEGHALTVDAIVPLSRYLELRGEAFDGRGLRGLGGGQIGQLFGRNGVVVSGRGGWGQVNLKPTRRLTLGGGYGFDDPNDADLPTTARLKNVVSSAHLVIRPAGPLVLGAEWRLMTTTYATRDWTNHHVNVGVGFEF